MTNSGLLVGAMGLASWRARFALKEYATAAKTGRLHHWGTMAPAQTTSPETLDLNEVGVTDAVMASLWKCGPPKSAYGVTAGAGSSYLAADIAVVQQATNRILLYRAKLGSLGSESTDLQLKSPISEEHVRSLRRETLQVGDVTYGLTGRLAIFQIDHTPYLANDYGTDSPDSGWWPWWGIDEPDYSAAACYYKNVIVPTRSSPSGVLAAPLANGDSGISMVPAASTWPWEFDIYSWLNGLPGLNGVEPRTDTSSIPTVPEFFFEEGDRAEGQPAVAAEFGTLLHEALNLPEDHKLYVWII